MPENRSDREALEFAEAALRMVKRPPAPEGIRERVMSRIRDIEAETSWLWRLLRTPGYAFAAGVLLFMMAGASLWISPAGHIPPAVSAIVSPLSPIGVSYSGNPKSEVRNPKSPGGV